MEIEPFDDVFDALSDTLEEAANMKARSDLLGVTRPRLNDLIRGKLSKFSLDALINLTTAAGLVLEIRVAVAA